MIIKTAHADLIDSMRDRYAPYGEMEAFDIGFLNYMAGNLIHGEALFGHSGVDAQAYDRGAEAAMIIDREARR